MIAEVAFSLPIFKTFHYSIPRGMSSRLRPGASVEAPFGPRKLPGVVVQLHEQQPDRKLKALETLMDHTPLLPAELLDLAQWLSVRYFCPVGEAIQAVFPSYVRCVPAASRKNTLAVPPPAGEASNLPPFSSPFVLTTDQYNAVVKLRQKMDGKKPGAALLFGVPASGKTEVYLALAYEAVRCGGQVLWLLPEISLTSPFLDQIKQRLPFGIHMLHSHVAMKKKRELWLEAASGKPMVVVGTRSACFLPFKKLRCIILDEEQDESYRQEQVSPRYHTREVVLQRAARHRALLVMGTATPSLESYRQASEKKLEFISMTQRVCPIKERPQVEIVNRKSEYGRLLSSRLLEKIADRIQKREQVILLVNRTGIARSFYCRECSWVARCRTCGTGLILGNFCGMEQLRCQQCSEHSSAPPHCPKCRKTSGLEQRGEGTRKVVSVLKEQFADARILRLDRDSVRRTKGGRSIVEDFTQQEADILVGTQLVAKGFHFSNVTLMGIVDADSWLYQSDFRTSEKAFQFFFHALGRAGRGEKPGELLIQTYHPENPVFGAVHRKDYLLFAEEELEFRKDLGYAPFLKMGRLSVSSRNSHAAARFAQKLVDELQSRPAAGTKNKAAQPPALSVLGPAAVPARGGAAYLIMLTSKSLTDLLAGMGFVQKLRRPSTVKVKYSVE